MRHLPIKTLDEVDSTNDVALAAGRDGAPHGWAVAARGGGPAGGGGGGGAGGRGASPLGAGGAATSGSRRRETSTSRFCYAPRWRRRASRDSPQPADSACSTA